MVEELPVQSAYRRALEMARVRGFQIGAENEERIRAAFAEVLRGLTADVQDGVITSKRATALREQAIRLLSVFEGRFADATETSVRLTLEEVAGLHRRVTELLFERAQLDLFALPYVVQQFDVIPTQALASILSRAENAATFQTVARRRLQQVVPQIDAFIEGAVARGVGAGRATLDLATILANQDADLIARLPRSLSSSLHRGVAHIDLARYGLNPEEVRRVRSILYDARRIQVSETNNALREANTRGLLVSPIVVAAKWQTSGRHPHTDACDVLASVDLYGYGPGLHPVDAWPFAPHPHCGCTQGGPVVNRPVREWNKPKGPGRPLAVDPSGEHLYEAWAGQWTPRERQRVREEVTELVRSANRTR